MSWISSIAAQHYRHPNHWAVWATSARKMMHLQPAQARAQSIGVEWSGPPQFLLTPIFWQDFPFHHIPVVTIWSSKFQKIPREGLTEPLSWPLPSRALPSIWVPPSNLRRFVPLIQASPELHPQTLEAWLRPCVLESICHVSQYLLFTIFIYYYLLLSQYLLLLTITPEVGL